MSTVEKTFIMIADDDPAIGQMLESVLNLWGYSTLYAPSKQVLLREFAIRQPDLVILDLEFGKDNGIKVIKELLQIAPDLMILLLTGFASIEIAVEAIKEGAYDFLSKPPEMNRLQIAIQKALEKQQLSRRVERLKTLVGPQNGAFRIWGDSPPLKRLMDLIASIAPTDVTALIQGESGTGKELVARAIHDQSRRANGPFIPVNMAALPRDLVESALFGHEKGSFTGADRMRIGHCEAADGGTLFLDEIGEMDLVIQAKLLRFLQEREIQRLGSNQMRPVNVRIVAATHRDLKDLVRLGKFREDLFYRLQVVPIDVPPLRARRGDIPLLAAQFLERSAARHGKDVFGFTPEALRILSRYDWPGNVRQLENLVERLVILSRGRAIDGLDLPPEFHAPAPAAPTSVDCDTNLDLSFKDVEKKTILDALQNTKGNVRAAAKLLGLGSATVYRKIKEYRAPAEIASHADIERAVAADAL